jgi:CopG-like RHH_1 or ribbon-helix-helix domain, RHH_5
MASSSPGSDRPVLFRSTKRLTITVAHSTLEALVQRSSDEGRSLSNLAAYLLESSLEQRFP